MSSDSDDDVEFTENYGNLINSTGACVPSSANNLNASSDYYPKVPSRCHLLPFAGAINFNRTKFKCIQKLRNICRRKHNASA